MTEQNIGEKNGTKNRQVKTSLVSKQTEFPVQGIKYTEADAAGADAESKGLKSETFCHANVFPTTAPQNRSHPLQADMQTFWECTMQIFSLSPTFKTPLAAHHSLHYSCVLNWPAGIKKSDQ